MIFRMALIVLLAFPAGLTVADSADMSYLQALQGTHYRHLSSKTLGHDLHLYVREPAAENVEDGQKLPTVYLLDGGVNFPLLSSYYHYLRITNELPPMVIVGISYGSDTFEGGNYRSSDFTAPSEERDWWGGAPILQQVLQQEIFPWVESEFPSDPDQRLIFGQSLGGQFVLYTALTKPEMFSGYIASNPALHRNLDFFLQWHGDEPVAESGGRLFVSLAEHDDERFRVPAIRWVEHWQQQESLPWTLEIRTLEDETHISAAPLAFREGIQWLYPPEPE